MLLSKIDSEKSLAKFLRYNPINEFEPFLESLGLSPSEYSSLLPQHLMFLSDDHLLLENFNVLCNYGIPRGRMGKMYKEAREIFSYDYGSLSLKLQDYENLSLSKSTVIKLASCCPTLLVGGVDSAFVKVMEKLSGLGLEKEWIGGYLSDDDSYNWRRLLDTMDFLEKVGYSTEQLNNFFQTNPELVFEGSEKMVYSLFGRLHKLGLKMNEIHSLIIQNPQILSAKCTKNLFRAVGFLFDIGMGAEDTRNMVATNMELLCSCSLKGPKTVCRELKISKESLCEIIREDPEKLFSLASKLRVKSSEIASHLLTKQAEKTTFLLKLGYVENSEEMMIAQKKFDRLVQAGLDAMLFQALLSMPQWCLTSKDVIETKIDWLTNCLGYPLHRFKLYVWLRDELQRKPMLSLSTILACSDARFEKYFVDNYPEGRTISLIGLRVTRIARNEARSTFDYLHSTRSYCFLRSEHISKNSPNFLQMLLSKIDSEKSLAKFLRYNPINEFEPFLESLGLSPSDDDHLLLENFNVLCNYGIPRGMMGKMYKEAREIFSYDYGSLSLKLQDYENLGLSKSTVIKLASCCPTLLVGGVNDAFVKVMEKLSGLGPEKEWIGGYLSMMTLIIGEDCLTPWIFSRKWAIAQAVKQLLSNKSRIGQRKLMRDHKRRSGEVVQIGFKLRVKSKEIASHLLTKQAEKTTFLVKLGYVENSEEMMIARKSFKAEGPLQERFDCLVQAGLDCHVVSSIIKHAPMVLNQSKDVIETKIDWLTNCLGYPLQSVVAFPAYLCYDLARIKKRFKLYVWLRDRGAAKPMLSLSTILACSDARFEKYFVDNYPEGRTMWENIRNVTSADQH
ncbi:hypothetical protein K2173_003590 [Erythroxylum novogranatense]|uniref:Uncharacterized protein n=1 Tax=Erythroxylum novogranatense TaxID=1862640 RepID=A0AAV8TC87_9ROSI|nr:hypothetical protein K2173_003590 [Erythroxylum novogranatense]